MSQDYLRDKVYPEIYSGYSAVLDAIYSARHLKTDTDKQDYLQYLQTHAQDLWKEYQSEGHERRMQGIPIDYAKREYQEVYLLRYFFPHSLLVPTVLDSLQHTDACEEDIWALFHWQNSHRYEDHFYSNYVDNRLLTTSFFACGPCPELYGLMSYLKNCGSRMTRISAAIFDTAPSEKSQFYSDLESFMGTRFPTWEFGRVIAFESLLGEIQNPSLYKFVDFESDLTAGGNGFLQPASEKWVKNSDLIVIQCCLNEIPISRHKQVLMNVTGVIDVMKHGALMLIIERQGNDDLFEKLRDRLEICHAPDDSIGVKYLNDNNIPPELIENLFLKKFDSGLWLANDINIRWLAIFT